MQDSRHFPDEATVAMRYLGKHWVPGGRGPDAFDCYGLCMDIYQNALGIDCSSHWGRFDCKVGASPAFVSVARPTSFSVVLMSAHGQSHAGIWLTADHGGVLHCVCGHGVIFTPVRTLKDIGIKIVAFYDYIQ